MAVLDDMDAKLDQLLSLMGEEVNIHPDTVWAHAPPISIQWPATTNMTVTLRIEWRVEDHENGRYLVLKMFGPYGNPVISRAWRCVHRPYPGDPGEVVDRPGVDPAFRK